MSLENLIVRAFNRRRTRPVTGSGGFRLGSARTLIGGSEASYYLQSKPTQMSFVCGRTGSGKTTMLLQLMAEHVRTGIPFLFVDFHGHATEVILAMIAASQPTASPILLEPWADPVVGWNPLEFAGDSAYAAVQELIAVFHRRLWPDAWGPRLENLLRMTLLPLTETKLTLLEATAFLSRPEFRRAVLQQVRTPEVREFWALRFEHLSPSQRSLISETVLNKISVFHDPALKYVVGQQSATLDFDRALSGGQTILVNLSTGSLRGNNFLLASLLVAKLKNSVYRRTSNARPYSLILDEFQEMISLDALDDYLRSFRKFRCSVYLATQGLQFSPDLRASIFSNCARFLCFATSATDAAFLGREFGGPEGNLVTELLPDMPTGQAIVKVRGEPVRLLRVAAPKFESSAERISEGREMCVQQGKSRREVEIDIEARLARFVPARTKETGVARPSSVTGRTEYLPEGYEGF